MVITECVLGGGGGYGLATAALTSSRADNRFGEEDKRWHGSPSSRLRLCRVKPDRHTVLLRDEAGDFVPCSSR